MILRNPKCGRPWAYGYNAMREDSAPWALECRLWALRSLQVISGFYNLISKVLAGKLSRSRVRVVLWYLSWWQSVSSYSKWHFCFIKSSVCVSGKSTHVTNLKFGAKGQYLHSFYYITRQFLASPLQSTAMEDLQVNLICEVGGLCICLVTYFLPRRTVTAPLNVEPLSSLTFPKIKLYLQQLTI